MRNYLTKIAVLAILTLCTSVYSFSQSLPLEVSISEDGRLIYGGQDHEGFYDVRQVHKLEITLTQANWFRRLDGVGGPNPVEGERLLGTLTYNDTLVLDSVYVSIKGNTSDNRNRTEKKSWKIEIDEVIDQDLLGYDNLNLNCAFQDHSGMREVLYYDVSKHFAPALKGSFVDVYLNGQYWGPYNNIQQIEGRYIQEWFLDNDGTRWRADQPDWVTGNGGPGGNRFGRGESTLNYNGPDSSDYNEHYTLKKSSQENPWQELIDATYALNMLPIDQLYDSLKYIIDVDRALWFLVQENVFADDDGYIFKGGMDYYVYWDKATDRIIPLEVDGNSILASNHITWSAFYNASEVDFPLLNRLLQNTELRQRYLAHLRTVLNTHFDPGLVHARVDSFAEILNQRVQDDPKKIYSYAQFQAGVTSLKNLITTRHTFLNSNTEVNRTGIEIQNVVQRNESGSDEAPAAGEEALITSTIESQAQKVMLYYGLGIDGVFERVEMFDDGAHNDGQANDLTYGASIPGYGAGNYVRYYVEVIKDDGFQTATYAPEGAEHDVFVYRITPGTVVSGSVVINEFMASNSESVSDQNGEFDDWIELYNNGNTEVDLSEYHLSDNVGNLTKWAFPEGSKIPAKAFLIVWADGQVEQNTAGEIHAGFKLSSGGEEIILTDSKGQIVDLVEFGQQQQDVSFARKPNGTGSFQLSDHTYNANNDGSGNTNAQLVLYPNPASTFLSFSVSGDVDSTVSLSLYNSIGQKVLNETVEVGSRIPVAHYTPGVYVAVIRDDQHDVVYSQKLIITE